MEQSRGGAPTAAADAPAWPAAAAAHLPLPPGPGPRCPTCLQITAEQILRESKALIDAEHKAPKVKITDPEELAEYRLAVRALMLSCDLPLPLASVRAAL